jgi:hypothetical protein
MADTQEVELILQVFGKICKNCGEIKDQRLFTKICQNEHECCRDCGKEIIKQKVRKCFECKEELSIIGDFSKSFRIS